MQTSSVRPTPRSNKLCVQAPHHQLVQNLMTRSLWQNISRIQGQKLLPFSVNVIVWENSWHFAWPSRVFPRNEIWVTSAEIPYYWRVTILEWGLFTRRDGYPCARVTLVSGLKIARVYKPWFHRNVTLSPGSTLPALLTCFVKQTWSSLWRTP